MNTDFPRWRLRSIAATCLLALFLTSCSFTVTPKQVTPHAVSDWAHRNVIEANDHGVLVTAEWIRVYHELLKSYSAKLPVSNRPATPDAGIAPENGNFRVSYEVSDRFADLKYFERNGAP